MNCMKCGRDADGDQMFCEKCLEEMKQYPVKPDAVVMIPYRPAGTGIKKVHQRRQTAEEQIAALEKRCRRLVGSLLFSLFLLVCLAVAAGITVYELDVQRWLGQNYSTYQETETTAPVWNFGN